MTIIFQRVPYYLNVIKICKKQNGKKGFQFLGNPPNMTRTYDIDDILSFTRFTMWLG